MSIENDTTDFERWLGKQTDLSKKDLGLKHEAMDQGVLPFFRATFYWWARRWPKECQELASAARVLAVGDLHIENFGTWRDAEGRLAWGINDFDECFPLPYTNDLVRLATSAVLAAHDAHLPISAEAACEAILAGYHESLDKGGRAFVLAQDHAWIGAWLGEQAQTSDKFWEKMQKLSEPRRRPPAEAVAALRSTFPQGADAVRVLCRVAGKGSLGKPRFVALGQSHGGFFAREAKALTPSANLWAAGRARGRIFVSMLEKTAIRSRDPLWAVKGKWIVRRLAPDCDKIELDKLERQKDHARLLRAMGAETANVHLGTRGSRNLIVRDLQRRPATWLSEAARVMQGTVRDAWKNWKCRAE
jgi:uncharacterized protein (DUF2252 family)